MPRMTPCTDCAQWIAADAQSCPHCGGVATRRGSRLPAAAIALGLSLGTVGCDTMQAEYGAAFTQSDSESDTESASDTEDTNDTEAR